MLLQIGHHAFSYHAVHQRTNVRVAQLGLGLPLKLCIGQLDGNNRCNPLAAVFTGDGFIILQELFCLAIGVQCPGERGLKARFMGAALGGMNVVSKGQKNLVIAVVVLERDFRLRIVPLAGEIDDLFVNRGFCLIDMLHKGTNAALIAHIVYSRLLTLRLNSSIPQLNPDACIQKCLLSEPLFQHIVVINQRLKNLTVGLEYNLGAMLLGGAHNGHRLGDMSPGELHLIDIAVPADPYLQPF